MGKSRSITIPQIYKDKGQAMRSVNYGMTARNLRNSDLGGVIFGCKYTTIEECLEKQLFRLPKAHISYVNNIKPGLPLFLFNYDERKLHGIFEAVSRGQLNIDPYAWTQDTANTTSFSAQVRMKVRRQCKPLVEEQFRPIIADNYYEPKLFWFELDVTQTRKLIELFESTSPPVFPRNNVSVKREEIPDRVDSDAAKKSWVSLVKGSSSLEIQDSNPSQVVESWEDHWDLGELKEEVKDDELVNSWEDHWDSGKLKEEVKDDEPVNSWEDHWDSGEQQKVDESEQVNETPSLESSKEIQSFDISQATATDISESYDLQTVMEKLMEQVEGLKINQLRSDLKIKFLEQKMSDLKLEIEELKKKKSVLVCGQASYSSLMDKSIMIIGGNNGSEWMTNVDSYSLSRDLMKPLSPLTFARSNPSVTKINGKILILGGTHGNEWFDTVELYNPTKNQWSTLPSLNTKKSNLVAAKLFGNIFAIGGRDGVQEFSGVEMFDVNYGRWIFVQPMNQKRSAPEAAEIDGILYVSEIDGILYVSGGYDGKAYSSTVERYDHREGMWRRIGTMNIRRGCHSMVTMNGKLFSLGGYDGSRMGSSIEVYEPRVGLWMMGEAMNYPRGHPGAIVINDRIYVLGGEMDKKHILNTTECYDEARGWEVTNLKGVGKRCSFSAVIMENEW